MDLELLESLKAANPSEENEVKLIDGFITTHATVYNLPDSYYKQLITLILQNRINNAAWQYEHASK